LSNWKSEMQRFAPTLQACFIHPSEAAGGGMSAGDYDSSNSVAGFDVVATTYGMLVRQSWLLDVEWRLAIVDEAQAIKNPAAHQSRAVKRLKSEARIALTGTPVENRLSDLWSLFDFLSPGLLGSHTEFIRGLDRLSAKEPVDFHPLRALVRPYILRRLKTDKSVISDLPQKTEVK